MELYDLQMHAWVLPTENILSTSYIKAPMNRKLRLYVSITLSGASLPTRQYDTLLSPDHEFNCIMWA